MMWRFMTLVFVVGLVAACSSASESSIAAEPTQVAIADQTSNGIARCDPNAALPSAPSDWYRDAPRYVGNEQPTEQVRRWASTRPGFQEVWIDRSHNGWVAAGFDRDVEQRQQEILDEFPDAGVVAVLVDWNLRELRQLQTEIGRHLVDEGVDSFGIAASMQHGLVQISFGVLTNDALAALAPYDGEPICVEGLDPEGAVLAGPQRTEGDGWRLLSLQGSARDRDERPTPTSDPPPTPGGIVRGTRVELATNELQLQTMWQANVSALAATPLPQIDFDTEVVVLVSDIESGSCPVRFDGMRVDRAGLAEQQLVLLHVVPDSYAMCTADANPITYTVAIQRDAVPAGPFTLAGPANLWVDADLTIPAAIVADSATLATPLTAATPSPLPPGFAPDPRPTAPLSPHIEPARPDPRVASVFPLVLEPGFGSTYDLPMNCFTSLGPINGYVWQIADGAYGPPDEWFAAVDVDGNATANLVLEPSPSDGPRLEVTVAGLSAVYQITDDALPTC